MKRNRVFHERVMTLTMSRHSTLPSKHNSLGTTYVPSMANYHDFRTDLLATLSSFTKISHFPHLAQTVTYGDRAAAANLPHFARYCLGFAAGTTPSRELIRTVEGLVGRLRKLA